VLQGFRVPSFTDCTSFQRRRMAAPAKEVLATAIFNGNAWRLIEAAVSESVTKVVTQAPPFLWQPVQALAPLS